MSDEETEETEEELQDRPNKFNTAEINGLEAKLMTALENQHYDTSSMQMQALEEEMEQSEKDSRPEDYISLSEIEKQQEAVLAENRKKSRTVRKAYADESRKGNVWCDRADKRAAGTDRTCTGYYFTRSVYR